MRRFTRTILWLLCLSIMAGLTTSSSCDKGTEPKKSGSMFGAWRMVRVVMNDTPFGDMRFTAENFLQMSGTGATASVLRINEDGSASVTTTWEDSSETVIPGTWTIDGNRLTMDGAGIDDTVLVDVDADTLTLTRTMPIDFYSDGSPEDTEIDMIYSRI
jgi:hypothetical protein